MQAERTALAWQRTGLSVAVAAAILARLTYGDLGAWALLALAVSWGCAAGCWWRAGPATAAGSACARSAPGSAAGPPRSAPSIVVMGLTELAALAVG